MLSKRRRKIAVIALLICGTMAVLFLATSNRPSGDVEWLSTPPPQRKPRLSFLGRWMWPVKAQLQRMKQRLTGPPAIVTVNSTVVEFDPVALAEGWTTRPRGFTNGSVARAFVIDDGELLRNRILLSRGKEESRPRVIVADGQQAQLCASGTVQLGGPTNVHTVTIGWWLDVWPRVHERSVDLTFFFTSTEGLKSQRVWVNHALQETPFVWTNAFGARIQIPNGESAFIFSGKTNASGKVLGIILTPTVQRPAKK